MRIRRLSGNSARSSKPTVIDLFAGAGLFSSAFVAQGFDIIGAYEIDPVAATTYKLNVDNEIKLGDIRDALPHGKCDVVIAGPPCQGFSTLGKKDQYDPRNYLCLEIVRFAKILKPKIIVIENVSAFLNAPIWKVLTSSLKRQNYVIEAKTLDAVDYGLPQKRVRSFTIASKDGLAQIKSRRLEGVPDVRTAWQGLSKIPNGENHHYSPTPSPLALARMRLIPPGGDKRDVMRSAPELVPPSWWSLGIQVTDVWGRMEWHKPANTIRTALQNPSKGRYIHPEEHRVISLREAARLQGIPDGWIFQGFPTQIARHIGNSVPLSLGRAVAKAVYESL